MEISLQEKPSDHQPTKIGLLKTDLTKYTNINTHKHKSRSSPFFFPLHQNL